MKIEIAEIPNKGRGIVARQRIREGQIIEKSTALVFCLDDLSESSILQYYIYSWNVDEAAIALGFGSLFNHSKDPNAEWAIKDDKKQCIAFKAIKNIQPGQEITIYYDYDKKF
jgi:hypothetical protein